MIKKSVLVAAIIMFAIGSATFVSCVGGDHSHGEGTHEHVNEEGAHEHEEGTHDHASVYQCPMQCEDDKTYDKAGKCPVCKMDLEEVKHDENEAHEHGEEDAHEHGDDDGHNH